MQRWLLLVGFLACGCTAGGSGFGRQRSSLSVSQGMVISQIYGAGGGAGASYHNDYVELFNRGNVAVDIGGWSVQYGSGTESINLQVNVPAATVVEPGQYFLVRLGSGGSTGAVAGQSDRHERWGLQHQRRRRQGRAGQRQRHARVRHLFQPLHRLLDRQSGRLRRRHRVRGERRPEPVRCRQRHPSRRQRLR